MLHPPINYPLTLLHLKYTSTTAHHTCIHPTRQLLDSLHPRPHSAQGPHSLLHSLCSVLVAGHVHEYHGHTWVKVVLHDVEC